MDNRNMNNGMYNAPNPGMYNDPNAGAYAQAPNPGYAPTYAPGVAPAYAPGVAPGYNPGFNAAAVASNWEGGVLETFCALLVTGLIAGLTFGIATPWAICYMWGFIIGKTNIDGRRLRFDGTGMQLFGNWIKWFLLIIITLGIYGFWVYPRLFQWVAKHTHFA